MVGISCSEIHTLSTTGIVICNNFFFSTEENGYEFVFPSFVLRLVISWFVVESTTRFDNRVRPRKVFSRPQRTPGARWRSGCSFNFSALDPQLGSVVGEELSRALAMLKEFQAPDKLGVPGELEELEEQDHD